MKTISPSTRPARLFCRGSQNGGVTFPSANFFRRTLWTLAATVLLAAGSAFAAAIVDIGVPGIHGQFPGASGSPGGDASATANSADPDNSATANPGHGGSGADGAPPNGPGGHGARGGDADATATTSVSTGNATATSLADGFKGSGGSGGAGAGSGRGGNGGDGGDGIASAIGSNSSGGSTTVSAIATGGLGGGTSTGGDSGSGGAATLGTVFGSSTGGGSVTVHGRAEGGGAYATGDNLLSGDIGDAGEAASVSLTDLVDGSTAGVLSLTQEAIGGVGGSVENGIATDGGSAFSSLSRTKSCASLTVTANAFARAGGTAYGPSGTVGNAGNATGIASATNSAGSATSIMFVNARGAVGGNGFGGTDGAAGGSASGNATATTSGDNHPVAVLSDVFNGVVEAGGGGASSTGAGGAGGNASTQGTGTAHGDSLVRIDLLTYGGNGGNVTTATDQPGGNGGHASVTAVGTSAGAGRDRVRMNVYAQGGQGGSVPEGNLLGSRGGDATATATASTPGGSNIAAYAYGGIGRAGNLGGTALARANASTAAADPDPFGGFGPYYAEARSSGNLITGLRVIAQNQPGGSGQAEARATVGRAAPARALANGLQAISFGTGLPTGADVSAALVGNPNAAASLPAGSMMLGLGLAGGRYPTAAAALKTTTTSFQVSFDVTQLAAPGNLKVAFLDPQFTGAGFGSARIRIDRELPPPVQSINVLDQTFSSLAAALAFFKDNVVDSGPITGGFNPSIGSCTVELYVTTAAAADSFNVNFLVANAPATTVSANASLVSLVPSVGTLDPAFASGTTSYTAIVSNSTDSLTLTPTVAESHATVRVNGLPVASGTASGAIGLPVGNTTINTVVTAQDGTTMTTYSLVVTRQTPIETWRQTFYGTPSNTGNAADNADPYRTGVPNLLVFAFFGPNQNPVQAAISQLPPAQRTGGNLFFSFTQPAGVSGITHGAEWSTTLLSNDWHAITGTGIGTQHIFSVPIGSNAKLFIRHRVTDP